MFRVEPEFRIFTVADPLTYSFESVIAHLESTFTKLLLCSYESLEFNKSNCNFA